MTGRRKTLIVVAALAALAAAVPFVWPRIDFWMLTGHFSPIRKVETLRHPVAVIQWDAAGLHLADGRTVELPGVGALPEDSPALREALKRGVEVRPDGRIGALVRIHHWCGNDPVREHVVQVDLSDMMTFLRLGQPATTVPEAELLASEPGGRCSEFGWNVSEFMQFQSWQSLRRPAAAAQPTGTGTAGSPEEARYGWCETSGEGASYVLTTKLTIPGLFDGDTTEFRIARYARFDGDGMPQLPPLGSRYASADGRNEKGGFGYGGGINVIEDDGRDDAIVLDVRYHWTTPEQVKGQLDRRVRAKVGVPVDVELAPGCRLQVSWRAVSKR